MNAKEIIDSVGKGINAAFQTSQKFLGERIFDENTRIKPEYISTVKIAEQLTGYDRVVKLENQMRGIGRKVLIDASCRPLPKAEGNNTPFEEMKLALQKESERRNESSIRIYSGKYGFPRKSTKRIDITVASNQDSKKSAPFLLIEVKLGGNNKTKFIKDLDRLAKLISMYNDAGHLSDRNIYGVIVFELMKEDCNNEDLKKITKKRLSKLDLHLKKLAKSYDWLKYKVGLIEQHAITEDATGYETEDGNGNTYSELAKRGFAFSPAMVLIGNAADIKDAPLKL